MRHREAPLGRESVGTVDMFFTPYAVAVMTNRTQGSDVPLSTLLCAARPFWCYIL